MARRKRVASAPEGDSAVMIVSKLGWPFSLRGVLQTERDKLAVGYGHRTEKAGFARLLVTRCPADKVHSSRYSGERIGCTDLADTEAPLCLIFRVGKYLGRAVVRRHESTGDDCERDEILGGTTARITTLPERACPDCDFVTYEMANEWLLARIGASWQGQFVFLTRVFRVRRRLSEQATAEGSEYK